MDDEAGFNLQRVSPLSAGEMTLRDYFAGQALVGQLANQEILNRHGLATENVVKAAYEIADAMLRARKEG